MKEYFQYFQLKIGQILTFKKKKKGQILAICGHGIGLELIGIRYIKGQNQGFPM